MEEPSAAPKAAAAADQSTAEVKAVVKKENTSSTSRDDEDRRPSKKRDFSAMAPPASNTEGTTKDPVKDQGELMKEEKKPQDDVQAEENQKVEVTGKVAGSDMEKVNKRVKVEHPNTTDNKEKAEVET